MNVYDTANRLATEIKQSEEYVNYKMAREALALNSDLKKKIGEFEVARYDAQLTQMQTGKEDEEKTNKMKELYAELIQIDDAKKYFDAEMKFNILLTDVNKIRYVIIILASDMRMAYFKEKLIHVGLYKILCVLALFKIRIVYHCDSS